MYRWVPSHRTSARLSVRSSRLTPVSVMRCPTVSSWKTWNPWPAPAHMLAHQEPSLNHALLSGFEPVGPTPAPVKEWSLKPTEPLEVTVGLGPELADVEPTTLVAVTRTLKALPMSAVTAR